MAKQIIKVRRGEKALQHNGEKIISGSIQSKSSYEQPEFAEQELLMIEEFKKRVKERRKQNYTQLIGKTSQIFDQEITQAVDDIDSNLQSQDQQLRQPYNSRNNQNINQISKKQHSENKDYSDYASQNINDKASKRMSNKIESNKANDSLYSQRNASKSKSGDSQNSQQGISQQVNLKSNLSSKDNKVQSENIKNEKSAKNRPNAKKRKPRNVREVQTQEQVRANKQEKLALNPDVDSDDTYAVLDRNVVNQVLTPNDNLSKQIDSEQQETSINQLQEISPPGPQSQSTKQKLPPPEIDLFNETDQSLINSFQIQEQNNNNMEELDAMLLGDETYQQQNADAIDQYLEQVQDIQGQNMLLESNDDMTMPLPPDIGVENMMSVPDEIGMDEGMDEGEIQNQIQMENTRMYQQQEDLMVQQQNDSTQLTQLAKIHVPFNEKNDSIFETPIELDTQRREQLRMQHAEDMIKQTISDVQYEEYDEEQFMSEREISEGEEQMDNKEEPGRSGVALETPLPSEQIAFEEYSVSQISNNLSPQKMQSDINKYNNVSIKDNMIQKFIETIFENKQVNRRHFKRNPNKFTIQQIAKIDKDIQKEEQKKKQYLNTLCNNEKNPTSNNKELQKILNEDFKFCIDCRIQNFIDREDMLFENIKNKNSEFYLDSNFIESIKTRKYRNCLNDIMLNRNSKGRQAYIQQRLKFKKYLVTENQQDRKKIISASDINIRTILFANNKQRQRRIERDMEEFNNLEPPDEITMIMNTIEYKIEEHLNRVEYKMLFMSQIQYQVIEKDLRNLFQSKISNYLNIIKDKLRKRISGDEKSYDNYALYIDKIWKNNKNNKPAFVWLTRTDVLDTLIHNLTMFDVKTKTSIFDVYQAFNWNQLEDNAVIFNNQIQKNYKYYPQSFQNSIDDIIERKYNLIPDEYSQTNINFIRIHREVMKNIKANLQYYLRVLPLLIKFKVGLCVSRIMDMANNIIFHDRYNQVVQHLDFMKLHQEQWNFQRNVQLHVDRRKLQNSIKEYWAFHFSCRQDRLAAVNAVFKSESINIMYKIYDPDNDFIVHTLIQNLIQKTKTMFVIDNFINQSQTTKVRQMIKAKKFYDDNALKKSRYHTINTSKRNYENHLRINKKTFIQRDEFLPKYQNSDQGEDVGGRQIVRSYKYKRQGAIDNYSREYCEFVIMEKIEKTIYKVKDKNSLYYRRIDVIIDEEDQEYNNLSRQFGWKCQITKDQSYGKQAMEVYIPILKKRGNIKLRFNERQFKKNKNMADSIHQIKDMLKEDKQKQSLCSITSKAQIEDKIRLSRKRQSILYDKFIDQQIDTDDSMRDIELDDIRSCCSSDDIVLEEECDGHHHHDDEDVSKSDDKKNIVPPKKKQKAHRHIKKRDNLDNIITNIRQNQKTPLEHYKHIMKQNKKKQVQQNSQASSDNIYDSDFTSQNSSMLNSKDSNKTGKLPKVFNIIDPGTMYDEDEDQDNFFKQMKNRYKIEGLIQNTNQKVQHDNMLQIKEYQRRLDYTRLIRDNAIESYGGKDAYENCKHGRALEVNLVEVETESIKNIKQFQESQDRINNLFRAKDPMMDQMYKELDGFVGKSGYDEEAPKDQNQISENTFGLSQDEQVKLANSKMSKKFKEMMQLIKQEEEPEEDQEEMKSLDVDADSTFNLENELKILNQIKKQKDAQTRLKDQQQEKRKFILGHLKKQYRKKQIVHRHKNLDLGTKIIHAINLFLAGIEREQQNDNLNQEDLVENVRRKFSNIKIEEPFINEEDILNFADDEGIIQPQENQQVKAIPSHFTFKNSTEENDVQGWDVKIKPGTLVKQTCQKVEVHKQHEMCEHKQEKILNIVKGKNLQHMEDMLRGFVGTLDEIQDEEGNGLLAIACQNNDETMLKLLLDKGRINPNTHNHQGDTPLHYAAAAKYFKCIDMLILFGACETCENQDKVTPWQNILSDI